MTNKEFKYLESVLENNQLCENILRKFSNSWDWSVLCRTQELSEDFIREFQDKVDWKFISSFQELSEDFIREFQDKVDWKFISRRQVLTKKFRKEFADKLRDDEYCLIVKQTNNFGIEFRSLIHLFHGLTV